MVKVLVRLSLSSLVVVALAATSAFAQDTIGISGTVRDLSGGVIVGAVVEAVVADRVVAARTTGADGAYKIVRPAGVPFALRARRAGFADHTTAFEGSSRELTHNIDMP